MTFWRLGTFWRSRLSSSDASSKTPTAASAKLVAEAAINLAAPERTKRKSTPVPRTIVLLDISTQVLWGYYEYEYKAFSVSGRACGATLYQSTSHGTSISDSDYESMRVHR